MAWKAAGGYGSVMDSKRQQQQKWLELSSLHQWQRLGVIRKKERREGEGELVTEDEGGDDLVVPFWNKKERGAQEERKENAGEGQKIPLNLVHNFN